MREDGKEVRGKRRINTSPHPITPGYGEAAGYARRHPIHLKAFHRCSLYRTHVLESQRQNEVETEMDEVCRASNASKGRDLPAKPALLFSGHTLRPNFTCYVSGPWSPAVLGSFRRSLSNGKSCRSWDSLEP